MSSMSSMSGMTSMSVMSSMSLSRKGMKSMKHTSPYQIPPYLDIKSAKDLNILMAFYNKITPFRYVQNGVEIGINPIFEGIHDVGYVYSFRKKPSAMLDETDYLFINSREETSSDDRMFLFESGTLFGLHSYGGYWMFFRPSLGEVIGLLSTKISLSQLEKISRIYVTTVLVSSDPQKGYDAQSDRHYGNTIYHILQK